MNIENMLYIYDDIPEEVQKLNRELKDILENRKQTSDTLKATTISDMPHGSGTSDPTYEAVERAIERYEERIAEIIKRIDWLLDTKGYIEDKLKALNIEEMRVIELRYFRGYKMRRLPYIIHFSLQHCYRIHDEAINKMINM